MRSFTLIQLLPRFSLLTLLAVLSCGFVTSPASASIAILQQPFDDSKVPMPEEEDDDDEIELPEFEFEIDPPNPGPGDDTPDPEFPWDVIVKQIVPGLLDLTGRPIDGHSTDEEEEGPGWIRLTMEGAEISKHFVAAGQLARPGNGNNNNNGGNNNDNNNGDNTGGNGGNGGEGEDGNKSSSFTSADGSLRWQTLGLRMVGDGQALWNLRAEAFGLPDFVGVALRFRLRFLISQDKVDIGVNLNSARLRRQFRRGKVKDEGPLGMTDGIKILDQLFNQKGEEDPGFCWDAADTNADGEVELRDAMHVFNHLFLGGPEPAKPYRQPGHGKLTDDDLACPSTREDLVAQVVVPAWADVARSELAAEGGAKCTQGSSKCIAHFWHTCDADGKWVKDSPASQCGTGGVIAPVETETAGG